MNEMKSTADIEKRVSTLLAGLTLEEKIGQMTQICIDAFGKGDSVSTSYIPFEFDTETFNLYISKYKIGSVLNVPSTTAITTRQWQNIVSTLQKVALKEMGIPLLYGVDSIHGANYTVGATLFPHSIALGATFNRNHVYNGAKVSAYETRASNCPWNFAPVVDLGRDPRWSRMWETYGEDPYLVSEMGIQALRGFQGEEPNQISRENVAACFKHYMAYGVPFSGRDRTPSYIPEHELREKHFAPYLKGVKEGVLSVMVNSGLINGKPVHANYQLLTSWLKEETGWDGVIVTDWADIDNLWKRDKIACDSKEAIKLAINAGVDMAMVPYDPSFCDQLKELVKEKAVSIKRIDDAVSRILRLKIRLGLFEQPWDCLVDYPQFGSDEFRTLSYDAAKEAITLLKNKNNILPIKKGKKILVCGPNADEMRCLHGGWSYSWQGNKTDEFIQDGKTIYKALCDEVGKANVVYMPGVTYTGAADYKDERVSELTEVVEEAREVDYIVVCLGENSYCETPGNLEDLCLSANQILLVQELAKAGKPIVLVLNEGRPRLISKIEEQTDAVLQLYLPGPMGGVALADILVGKVNPSGKLPYTYPQYPNHLSTYDHKPSESLDVIPGAYGYDAKVAPQWEFGYGLSYTTFSYANLRSSQHEFRPNDIMHIQVDVTNTGMVAGKETVLLYIQDCVASLTPDVKRLRRFTKIELQPFETQTIDFDLPAHELAFVGEDGQWIIEAGKFNVQVAELSIEILCLETYSCGDDRFV